MINKLIKLLFLALLFMTPLVMYAKTSEIFELNKMLFIYTITLLITFLWSIHLISSRRNPLKKIPYFIALAAFLITQGLSTLASIDKQTSTVGYYGRFNGGLLSILSYAILGVIFVDMMRRRDAINMLRVSLASSAVVFLWGLPGKFGYDLSCFIFTNKLANTCWTDQFRPAERMFSTLGQPNWLGAYLAIHFFIGIYFFIRSLNDKKLTWLYGAYIPLNFIGLLWTRSRSSLLSVAIGSVVVLGILYVRKFLLLKIAKTHRKIIALFVALFLISYGVFWVGIKLPSSVSPAKPAPQVVLSSEVTESLDIRKIVWRGAWLLALKYPLLGTGPETFAYSYFFTRPLAHNNTSEWDFIYNKAHNEFLNYLATTGFVGFAAYMALIIVSLKLFIDRVNRADHDEALLASLLLGSYVSILVTNFFGFSTSTINVLFYLHPLVVLVYANTSAHIYPSALGKVQKVLAAIAAVIAMWIFTIIVTFFLADINYAKGQTYYQEGQFINAMIYYSNAYKLQKMHVYEDRLSSVYANLAVIAPYQKSLNTKPQQFIELSRLLSQDSLAQSPENVQYWKTKGKDEYLYYQATLEQSYLIESTKSLAHARELAPTDPRIPYTESLIYSLIADELQKDPKQEQLATQESLAFIARSIALKPDYIEAYILQAQLLKKAGEVDRAQNVREYILKHFPQVTKKQLEDEL